MLGFAFLLFLFPLGGRLFTWEISCFFWGRRVTVNFPLRTAVAVFRRLCGHCICIELLFLHLILAKRPRSDVSGIFNFFFDFITEPLFFLKNLKFMFMFGCTGSSLLCKGLLSLPRVGPPPWLQHVGFSLRWHLLSQSTHRLSSRGTQA